MPTPAMPMALADCSGMAKPPAKAVAEKTQRHSVVMAKKIPEKGPTRAVVMKGKSHLYSQWTMMTHQLIKKWVNTLEDIVG